ncbi:hypothetical protein D3C76_1372490 [compost metagenome]
MGCCIVVAMLISQVICLWERARENLWLNVLAISLAVASVGLLAWHWHHVEELIINPFAFTFISDLLNQAGSFCRTV